MTPQELVARFRSYGDQLAVAWNQRERSYFDLCDAFFGWQVWLQRMEIPAGAVVSIEGEFGPTTPALLLALAARRCVIVPLSHDSSARRGELKEIAQVEFELRLIDDAGTAVRANRVAYQAHYDELKRRETSGLVLFTSGSTGHSKAAVHDFARLLDRYAHPRPASRALLFLQLDHIGGLNTLFHTLANGGAILVPQDRSPRAICEAIERWKAELLPTSPTFLNLLLVSEEHRQRDLSSLKVITYGTEPMPASTLAKISSAFPHARLQQTYGMTELGILRSQSRERDSLWVRVGGDGYETRVKEGRLWIRAHSAMLGYLNAPAPFDDEGFLDTGDRVEVDGPWLRILGRDQDTVNVGGHKVFPAEVESVLLELEGVVDVAVRGEPQPLTGQMVSAVVRLAQDEPLSSFKVRLRQFCRDRLPTYAIPAKIELASGPLHSERFKKSRR